MTRKILLLAIGLWVVGGVLAARHFLRPGTHPNNSVPALAPNFNALTLSGARLNLSDYRGKIVLLDFWATWCEPCQKEIPGFIELQNRFGRQGLQIIGVSMDDSPDPVREFQDRFNMNYPVVLGDAKLGETYGGILGLPIVFLIDRQGYVYRKHIGQTDTSVFEREISELLSR